MADIRIENDRESGYTLLSNDFIDNYMPKANPAFVLIYIYLLRNAAGGVNTENMAENLFMLESDIIRGFKYWDKEGLIKFSQNESEINISLGSNKKKTAKKAKEPVGVDPDILNSKPPKYNPVELEMYKNDYEEISQLFEYAEHTLGKMLRANELSTLYSFYDWLRLPIDVIRYLLEYCAENGHRNMKYIETVALNWVENGINTVEAAKAHLNIFNKDYREVLKALGMGSRTPATKEIELMDKWYKEWEFPLEIILEACDKTIMAVGKGQFNYVDRILKSWHEAEAKTIEDIKKIDNEFRDNKPAAKEKAVVREIPKRKNRFTNYEQHVRDYSEIEKLENEYLLNKLKGGADE